MQKLKIATHNKTFHADEVTAIALLKVFGGYETEVSRVGHQCSDFDGFDMVIDIGRKFDGVKYFDHHQHKGGKSSAGLIWDYLAQSEVYPQVSRLIEIVDKQDVGEKKAGEFEYPNLVKYYNHPNLTSPKQEEAFGRVVEFAHTILSSMKEAQEMINVTAKKLEKLAFFDKREEIVYLDEFVPNWDHFINGTTHPDIKAVVWRDAKENNYKVKLTPKTQGSFEFNTSPLQPSSEIVFVHSAGFFAVAGDRRSMSSYLKEMI